MCKFYKIFYYTRYYKNVEEYEAGKKSDVINVHILIFFGTDNTIVAQKVEFAQYTSTSFYLFKTTSHNYLLVKFVILANKCGNTDVAVTSSK